MTLQRLYKWRSLFGKDLLVFHERCPVFLSVWVVFKLGALDEGPSPRPQSYRPAGVQEAVTLVRSDGDGTCDPLYCPLRYAFPFFFFSPFLPCCIVRCIHIHIHIIYI